MTDVKAFSAPGKAFIAGGYLVLDPNYDAYVVALSSRMHAVVKSTSIDGLTKSIITISSPQFHEGKWSYIIDDTIKETNNRKNPFLEATVEIVAEYLKINDIHSLFNLEIVIFSDPGFHTQESTTTKTSSNGTKLFLYHSKPITEVAKTGLGSSASLVSVVITAIMSQFNSDFDNDENKNLLHNLAQIAHCKAQKKIGSGFDVATAIYGSIRYRRFKPELINDYLQHPHNPNLNELVNNKWDFTHLPCALPPHIRLLMGDIKGGSETPKLVSLVLKWKAENPQQSESLYHNLSNANLLLIDALTKLHRFYQENQQEYMKGINYLKNQSISNLPESECNNLGPFLLLIEAIKNIRIYLKQLTTLSTADIEPDSQTTLLDNCLTLKGCLGGVVPGAGGYDAISLLVIDESIDCITEDTKTDDRFSQVIWLNLKVQSQGLIAESAKDYDGLYN